MRKLRHLRLLLLAVLQRPACRRARNQMQAWKRLRGHTPYPELLRMGIEEAWHYRIATQRVRSG